MCLHMWKHWHTGQTTVLCSWPWDVDLVCQSSQDIWSANMSSSWAEQVFITEYYFMSMSYVEFQRSFRRVFPELHNPNKRTLWCLVNHFCETGSMDNKKWSDQPSLLTSETLHDVHLCLIQSPKKSIRRLSQQRKKSTLLWVVPITHLDPVFFTDQAWFHLSGYVNSQNRRIWSSINPNVSYEVPLHHVKNRHVVCSSMLPGCWSSFLQRNCDCWTQPRIDDSSFCYWMKPNRTAGCSKIVQLHTWRIPLWQCRQSSFVTVT
jgi:hypothetical protein